MRQDGATMPIEGHDLWKIAVDEAANKGGGEAARALLGILESARDLLSQVKSWKMELAGDVKVVRSLTEGLQEKMLRLWGSATRLPERLEGYHWPVRNGYPETASQRIETLCREIRTFIETFKQWKGGVCGFTATRLEDHIAWGILVNLEDVVRQKYSVELALNEFRSGLAQAPEVPGAPKKRKPRSRVTPELIVELIAIRRAQNKEVPDAQALAREFRCSAATIYRALIRGYGKDWKRRISEAAKKANVRKSYVEFGGRKYSTIRDEDLHAHSGRKESDDET